ncbi:MAG: PTS galactitol transporter subunit IIC, partial [Sphingobium sp. 32-64-5]
MSGDAGGTVALIAPFAGWLAPLEEVPDPVFAEHMMGDGVAIDPVEGLLRAPADGEVLSIPASAHAVTLRLRNGAELLVHIGLETVALGGKGFTPRVAPGAQVRAGEPLIAFDLDALAGSVKALITPLVVANEGYALHREQPGPVEAGSPIARVERIAAAQAGTGAAPGERHERMLTVAVPHGIHARPAARIAAALKPFAAEVTLRRGDRVANARSTVALLGLGAVHGEQVMATATGSDARAAVETLAALLDRIAAEEAA